MRRFSEPKTAAWSVRQSSSAGWLPMPNEHAKPPDRPRAPGIVVPHRVRRTGWNDHPLAASQKVIDARHSASHRAFEHLQRFLLLCMYVIARRRRDRCGRSSRKRQLRAPGQRRRLCRMRLADWPIRLDHGLLIVGIRCFRRRRPYALVRLESMPFAIEPMSWPMWL